MNNSIPFMKYRKIAGLISIALFSISVLTLGFRGLTLGLDFSGGTLVEISYEEPVNLEEIRSILIANNFEDSQVVNFGTDLDVLIKVADRSGNSKLGDQIFTLLEDQGLPGTLKRSEFVGPQVGSELRDQGGVGMLVALFMILLYVAFRFQYKFALGAVTALTHDVVIILGFFSIFAWDFDLTVLAALLAVIGRTIITSFTTLLVLFALFIFGGDLIRGFSLALILGVLIGTYSSIYIVANMLMSLAITQEDMAIPEPEGADFDEMP